MLLSRLRCAMVFGIVAALFAVWNSDYCGASTGASVRPNVIVILTDDQGWGDTSCTGNRNHQTPNIDSLAMQGATFNNFYVCAVCSPTRAEFLTGRYHLRGGVFSTSAGGERLDTDETTVADAFQAAGYATGCFGKWHNGMQFPYHPNARGFDEFYGFCSGHWGNYFDPMLERNGRIVKGKGFIVDDLTSQAMNFIESNRDRPFFVYLPYNTPHWPPSVPDENWKKYKDLKILQRRADRHTAELSEELVKTRSALALVDNIDMNVGRLLELLNRLEIAEDTLVLFFNDNGPNSNRWNDGLKGRKGSTDEGGVRSPLLVRWPAKVQAGQYIDGLTAAIDLLPTLCELAGVRRSGELPLDGKSFATLMLNPESPWPDRVIANFWKKQRSVRNQRFRLDNTDRLFDIENDRGQQKDVSAQYPEMAFRLKNAKRKLSAELQVEFEQSGPFPRPFVIGHPASMWTQLPARDGRESGNIRRSNRYPNCSYFLNWTSTEDAIEWPVEIGQSGNYRVHLYYGCSPENVGCRLQLTCGDSRIEKVISAPHESGLLSQQYDRWPRVESWVKEFKPMVLGTVALEAGKADLVLKATEIPGDEAIEFRLLVFERLE